MQISVYKALQVTVINRQALWAMIFIQFAYAGMALICKAALNDGISPLVFNAYRQAIATLVLAPFALLLERRTNNMWSLGLFCKIFLAALCGPTVSLDLYYLALQISSATVATAILNTIPLVTFLLSVLLRIETVGWSTFPGILKIFGMAIAIGGAMLLSFFGPIGSRTETSDSHDHVGNNKNRFLGPVLLFLCSVAWSIWLIVQPHLLKQYPSKLRLSTLQCLLSSVQATVAAAALQRNLDSWKIGWNIQLASLAYCEILVTGVLFGLQVWCIEKKGPFYVAMFSPLTLVLTAIFSAFVLAESLSCGSILGGVMIIGGLYSLHCSVGKEQAARRAIKYYRCSKLKLSWLKRAKMLKTTPPILQPHDDDHNAFIMHAL